MYLTLVIFMYGLFLVKDKEIEYLNKDKEKERR